MVYICPYKNCKKIFTDKNYLKKHENLVHCEKQPIFGINNYFIDKYGKIYNKSGKEIKQRTIGLGYKLVTLYLNGTHQSKLVHRLVIFTFKGPPPTDKHTVHHINRNPSDNRFCNLFFR